MPKTAMDPSRRRITISDIAAQAGVSTAGVSYALNGRKGVSAETRRRVLRIADELGWSPTAAARSLAGAETQTVGLVLARDPRVLGMESYYLQFLFGIETVLSQHAYGLLLQVVPTSGDDVATMKRWRASRRVDGVLLVDIRVDDPRIPLSLQPDALPAVVVGHPVMAGGLASVWTDEGASMREVVDYLIGLGHTEITRVSGSTSFAYTTVRDDAFVAAMTVGGLRPSMIRSDYTPDAGAEATRRALSDPHAATALIFDNDDMAVAALSIAAELGLRVPADLSVVSWDDSPLCQYVRPQLTALGHDVMAFGAHATGRLLDLIAGVEPASHQDSTSRLRVRASTGRVPGRPRIR